MTKTNHSVFTPPDHLFATPPSRAVGLPGCAPAMLISAAARQSKGWLIVIVPDSYIATRLITELTFFLADDNLPCVLFPDWETLPYDHFSPHQDIISDRIKALYLLRHHHRGVLVVTAATALQRLAPVEYLDQEALFVRPGDQFDINNMRLQLEDSGYHCVNEVNERGEFAVRGALVDIFPTGSAKPYRIDLLDDEVESLREFDPDTQRTIKKIAKIELLPAREFPLNRDSTLLFRQQFRSELSEYNPKRSLIYREISEQRTPNGIEYYLPLFFEAPLATLFDYSLPNTRILSFAANHAALDAAWMDIESRYEQLRHDIERPLLPPDALYLRSDEFNRLLETFDATELSLTDEVLAHKNRSKMVRFGVSELSFELGTTTTPEGIRTFVQQVTALEGRVLLCASSAGRQEYLADLLIKNNSAPVRVRDWAEFQTGNAPLNITVFPLEQGVSVEHNGASLHLIAEADLFGYQPHQSTARRRDGRDAELILRNLTDLQVGSPVVHIDHGIGRFMGLVTLDVDGLPNEFIALEYAQKAKLYVPVSSLHLISRYSASGTGTPPLHRLGSPAWEKARAKAREQVRDTAAELLDIYARRAKKTGFATSFDSVDYEHFVASFPFAETPDQESTIQAVIEDMRADQPMDRIVCGDVGFGKTEVALRAAFIAVQGGGQVCLLVPTTLLAQQHTQNFRDRFADWGCRIEVISRFESPKVQKQILEDLAAGQIDIIIGTHRLLQKDVHFKNLRLLIIDEEHRFGVNQKEQIKSMRVEVDILTLTATPIPRTLNQALASLRDLSIIATPPPKRLSVKTMVSEWDNVVIREACLREIKRGGQIYFLHNEVKTIERMERELTALLPEARIRHAHGQMREKELEQVMLDFYHQRFNLLVCSTIIESGIDVPTANTIIINRADKLGLAQLHQLRGRVGRSHHRAYAVLLSPPARGLSSDAARRLEAITELEELGSGFLLANQDLEIRGAGEFLGDEQSGHIHEIGYTLYMEMLEKAVEQLREDSDEDTSDKHEVRAPEIELGIPALLPADYLPDIPSRLIIYKRIANAKTLQQLDDLQVEMIDRFGLLPPMSKHLFSIAEIRIQAGHLGVVRIDAGPKGAVLELSTKHRVNVATLLDLIQYQPDRYQLSGQDKLRVVEDLTDSEKRLSTLSSLLDKLSASAVREGSL